MVKIFWYSADAVFFFIFSLNRASACYLVFLKKIMEKNRLKPLFFEILFAVYQIATGLVAILFLSLGISSFFEDEMREYCIYKKDGEYYDFVEGSTFCEIDWGVVAFNIAGMTVLMVIYWAIANIPVFVSQYALRRWSSKTNKIE